LNNSQGGACTYGYRPAFLMVFLVNQSVITGKIKFCDNYDQGVLLMIRVTIGYLIMINLITFLAYLTE